MQLMAHTTRKQTRESPLAKPWTTVRSRWCPLRTFNKSDSVRLSLACHLQHKLPFDTRFHTALTSPTPSEDPSTLNPNSSPPSSIQRNTSHHSIMLQNHGSQLARSHGRPSCAPNPSTAPLPSRGHPTTTNRSSRAPAVRTPSCSP